MSDLNALVVKPNISGDVSPDNAYNISLDVNIDSGNIRYTLVSNDTTPPGINSNVNVCGIIGCVERVGLTESRSEHGFLVEATYGSTSKSKSVYVSFPLDVIYYKAVTATQIINDIASSAGLTIDMLISEYHFESYEFRGRAIDAIKDIASKCFAEAIIMGPKHWAIVAPYKTLSSYTEPSTLIVSRQNLIVNNTAGLAAEYFNKLLAAYLELAKLLAKRKSIAEVVSGSTTTVRENVVPLQLSFGNVNGSPQPIKEGLIVESLNWDNWEHDVDRPQNPNGKWKHAYFKTESLKAPKTNVDIYGKTVTTDKGKKRGLYAMDFVKILIEIPISDGTGEFYARGKMLNLVSYNSFKSVDLHIGSTGDEKWQKINIESRSVKTYNEDGTTFTYVTKYYVVLEPDINTINNCVAYKTDGSGASTGVVDPVQTYANQAAQHYMIDIQILRPAYTTMSYKFIGTKDNHDRVITSNGEVILWLDSSTGNYYYPIAGMDILFKALATTDPLITSTTLDPNFVNDTQYYTSLETIWTDLKKLIKTTTPVAKAGTGVDTTGKGTPISSGDITWIYDIPTGSGTPKVIGYTMPNNKIVSNGFPTKPLTLGSVSKTSDEMLTLYLKLKILCLQDQINGCKSMIKLYSCVDLPNLATSLKNYLVYLRLAEALNNVDVTAFNTIKEDAMEELNTLQDKITMSVAVSKEVTYTVVEKNVLPLPGEAWKGGRIQRVSFNGTTATIVANTKPELAV